MIEMASARLAGRGLMPSARRSESVSAHTSSSAPSGRSRPSSMPRRPAARIIANDRYGLHAESRARYSMRVELPLPGLYMGTRMSADRLLWPQQTYDGASPPPHSRLYEFT